MSLFARIYFNCNFYFVAQRFYATFYWPTMGAEFRLCFLLNSLSYRKAVHKNIYAYILHQSGLIFFDLYQLIAFY